MDFHRNIPMFDACLILHLSSAQERFVSDVAEVLGFSR